jgi:hypothetical protein
VLLYTYVACFVKKLSLNLRKSWSVSILCILYDNLIWPAGFDDLSAVTEYRGSRFLRNVGKFIPDHSGRSSEYYIMQKSQFEGCSFALAGDAVTSTDGVHRTTSLDHLITCTAKPSQKDN